MDKQAEIEEMAVVLTDGGCKTCVGCTHNNRFQCKPIYDAELLYNAGYRKQSEGEWELGKSGVMSFCSTCGYWAHPREVDEWDYCPRCGAKMREEDDGK